MVCIFAFHEKAKTHTQASCRPMSLLLWTIMTTTFQLFHTACLNGSNIDLSIPTHSHTRSLLFRLPIVLGQKGKECGDFAGTVCLWQVALLSKAGEIESSCPLWPSYQSCSAFPLAHPAAAGAIFLLIGWFETAATAGRITYRCLGTGAGTTCVLCAKDSPDIFRNSNWTGIGAVSE